ncbi:MAG: flagellar biosynthetic protein FliR, partial [Polymorphobacter sp.]
ASLRCGAALAVLPGIGALLVPLRVRIGLSGAVGLLVLGTQPLALPADMLGAAGLLAVAGEIAVGLMAGLVLHIAFGVASIAGELLTQSMGLGFASIIDPGGASNSVLATFLGLLMWLVLLGLGAHLRLIELLVQSYATLPPGSDPFVHGGALVEFGAFAFANGLLLAAPVASLLLLVNLLLAVTARSAPQLNIFSIGFPALLVAGLVALPVALPVMVEQMAAIVEAMQDQLARVLLG